MGDNHHYTFEEPIERAVEKRPRSKDELLVEKSPDESVKGFLRHPVESGLHVSNYVTLKFGQNQVSNS